MEAPGQEIGLHLHPKWLTDPRYRDLPRFVGHLLHEYSAEHQSKLIRASLALGSKKDHARALRHGSLAAPAIGQDAQLPLELRIQFDLVGNSHRSNLLQRSSVHSNSSPLTLGEPH